MKLFWSILILGLVFSTSHAVANPSGEDIPSVFHVRLTNPLGGEVFTAGAVIRIEWTEDVAHNMTNWDVFYSTDGGSIFRSIRYNLPREAYFYQWTLPNIATTQAQVRIVQDNEVLDYISTSPNFTIQAITTDSQRTPELPETAELFLNYPNPFSASTEVGFSLPREGRVLLQVFDVAGNQVATLTDRFYSAGIHRLRWNAELIPPGFYISRLVANDRVRTSSMIIIR